MDTWDIGNLAYLGLLGVVLILWLVMHNRLSLGRTLQQAAGWALIFIGVIAAVGLWDDIRREVLPGRAAVATEGRIEVPRAPDGHFYLTLLVNDAPVKFMIDTGATGVVLSRKDAERAGIAAADLAFTTRASTANGKVRTAPVRIDRISLGPVEDRKVRGWVNDGEMDQSLLGMTYLDRWGRIEIARGTLVLER
ncbi:retropepsin-like aspartic protease family protein [Pseudodonghicola flavimaris]|uniref:TIGR02281 family clan AA aspartic protease n=1 Tax=Pseudodonghicola flavimaris TaxID=3050036 RepID=A0ABT7EVL7_9RHOB|nr:TIGR02281 family clan AA aspartic protease [Pseudodonghicola flavimaris]MDK3016389.1 TIGR02281 family clan AA aspartic protease [Pseudodonghicola flavimaris]